MDDYQDKIVDNKVLRGSIGIEALGGSFIPVIESGASCPCEENVEISTAHDNQTSVWVHVFVGEGQSTNDKGMIDLGQYEFSGILPGKRGEQKVDVVFAVTGEGRFKIWAKDHVGGLEPDSEGVEITSPHAATPEAEKPPSANQREGQGGGLLLPILGVIGGLFGGVALFVNGAHPFLVLVFIVGGILNAKTLVDRIRRS